jgi:hypothetical protein
MSQKNVQYQRKSKTIRKGRSPSSGADEPVRKMPKRRKWQTKSKSSSDDDDDVTSSSEDELEKEKKEQRALVKRGAMQRLVRTAAWDAAAAVRTAEEWERQTNAAALRGRPDRARDSNEALQNSESDDVRIIPVDPATNADRRERAWLGARPRDFQDGYTRSIVLRRIMADIGHLSRDELPWIGELVSRQARSVHMDRWAQM